MGRLSGEHCTKFLKKLDEQFATEFSASVNAVKTEIAKFEKILDDGRNYLLGTESPTYVDFQLAAIMGLIIVIDEYGGGVIEPDSVLTPDERGPERVAVDKEIRETKLGKFALKMYREHRNAKRN